MIVRKTSQTDIEDKIVNIHLSEILQPWSEWKVAEAAYKKCALTGQPQVFAYEARDGYSSIAKIIKVPSGFICNEIEETDIKHRKALINLLTQATKNLKATLMKHQKNGTE